MGWGGYGIYDGDGTQTLHYSFIKWSKIEKKDDVIEEWLKFEGTKIPKELHEKFLSNVPLILKKMPKIRKFWDEDRAIEWQMLLALFLDNKMPIPKEVKENGIEATEFLMTYPADDFCDPSARRRNLKKFIQKAEKCIVG